MKVTQWQQEIVKPVVQLTPSNVSNTSKAIRSVEASSDGCTEKKAARSIVRPPREQPLPCPRCNSTNTKFCYYNNYSLTQPRYFCKGCRRYWTEGGSLRNIPVGGCSRKNKRSPPSSSANEPGVVSKKPYHVLSHLQNPNSMIHPPEIRAIFQGLNLTFPAQYHQDNYRSSISDLAHMSNNASFQTTATPNNNDKSDHDQSALELLTGMTSSGGGLGFGGGFSTNNSFMHISDPDSAARYSDIMQDFKSPTLDFSLEYGLDTSRQSNSGVVLGMSSTSQNDLISTIGGGTTTGRDLMSPPFDNNNVKNQQQAANHYQHHYEQQDSQNRGHGSVSITGRYWTSEMLGDGNRSS